MWPSCSSTQLWYERPQVRAPPAAPQEEFPPGFLSQEILEESLTLIEAFVAPDSDAGILLVILLCRICGHPVIVILSISP